MYNKSIKIHNNKIQGGRSFKPTRHSCRKICRKVGTKKHRGRRRHYTKKQRKYISSDNLEEIGQQQPSASNNSLSKISSRKMGGKYKIKNKKGGNIKLVEDAANQGRNANVRGKVNSINNNLSSNIVHFTPTNDEINEPSMYQNTTIPLNSVKMHVDNFNNASRKYNTSQQRLSTINYGKPHKEINMYEDRETTNVIPPSYNNISEEDRENAQQKFYNSFDTIQEEEEEEEE